MSQIAVPPEMVWPRMIVTLSSVPARIPLLFPVLEAMLNQTRLPDQVYVHLSDRTMRGQVYSPQDIEHLQHQLDAHPLGRRVLLHRCPQDYGPITKVVPVLPLHFSFGPDAMLPFRLTQPLRVDWIEGTGGICVQAKWLQSLPLLDYSLAAADDPLPNSASASANDNQTRTSSWERMFRWNDDHWLAWHLQRQGTTMWVVPVPAGAEFTNTPQSNLQGLSQQPAFWNNVRKLARHLQAKGVYQQPGHHFRFSLVFWAILLLALVATVAVLTLRGLWRACSRNYQAGSSSSSSFSSSSSSFPAARR